MLSPVCTPIGSTFSIEQMTTKLSAQSRMTSSSNSFQPMTDSSTRISWTGLIDSPRCAISRNSSTLYAIPPPTPPRVKDGRMMLGNPSRSAASTASASDLAYALSGTSMSIERMASLNFSRSSATWIASIDAPISRTPCFSSTPRSASSTARFNAVCPPTVGSRLSGFSRAITRSSTSAVSGSTYVRSANSGSVMIVAGLLLTSTTSSPSPRSALQACVPE